MTFEDSQKMLIISQSNSIRDESNSLFGEIRQTLAEIRADFQDCILDFERDCALTLPFISNYIWPSKVGGFLPMEKPYLDNYTGFAR